MPRLIDDMRAARRFAMPTFVSKERAWQEYAQRIAPMVLDNPQLPVLLIDNVAKYYYEGNDQEYWDLTKDFPNLAPPYPQFWCEYKLPKWIISKDEGNTNVAQMVQHGRAGVLITAIDPANATYGDGEPPANTRWVLWCDLWIDFGWTAGRIDGPHGATFMCVDAEGRIISTPWMQSFAPPELAELMKSVMGWFHPAYLAVSFLHCKNVTVQDWRVDKPLAKKWASKHAGLRLTAYKTLIIEPLRQILRREGGSDKVGLQKAVHICRGHFRDYREGRGLFGKYHGQFWMPSIVRGTKGDKAPPREIEVKV